MSDYIALLVFELLTLLQIALSCTAALITLQRLLQHRAATMLPIPTVLPAVRKHIVAPAG
jgi:hypothetical protein